jgi:hypothetical protein
MHVWTFSIVDHLEMYLGLVKGLQIASLESSNWPVFQSQFWSSATNTSLPSRPLHHPTLTINVPLFKKLRDIIFGGTITLWAISRDILRGPRLFWPLKLSRALSPGPCRGGISAYPHPRPLAGLRSLSLKNSSSYLGPCTEPLREETGDEPIRPPWCTQILPAAAGGGQMRSLRRKPGE